MSANEQADDRIFTAKVVNWCLYDWANSPYSAIVLSFVFAPYFLIEVAENELIGTVQWTWAMTVSSIAIGVLSPILGAFGDRGGGQRLWLAILSGIAVVTTANLWFVEPHTDFVILALVLVAVSNLGFELAYVFYNAMLPQVAAPGQLGRVSGLGWGLGYFGAIVAMVVVWFALIAPSPPLFGLDESSSEPVRATAILAAVWFLVFALPLVLFGPSRQAAATGARAIVTEGLAELWSTLKSLRTQRSVAWYLIAHMAYIDGVNTLIVFGPLFAAGTFGFTQEENLLYGISFFAAAGVGSVALGWIDDLIGGKWLIAICLAGMSGAVGAMLLVDAKVTFWVLSMLIALLIGPVQSASRSLMARLAPEDRRTQLFGLYSLAGRATAPLGTALVGWIVSETETQRAGAVVIGVLMLAGLLLLFPVRER